MEGRAGQQAPVPLRLANLASALTVILATSFSELVSVLISGPCSCHFVRQLAQNYALACCLFCCLLQCAWCCICLVSEQKVLREKPQVLSEELRII